MERTQGRGVLAGNWLERMRARGGLAYAHSLAVGSGKGGTGKSVITASLAACFAKQGRKTVVFDSDLGVGNAHILQGVSPAYTAAHVVSGMVELADIGIAARTGVTVLPAGSGIAGMASLAGHHLQKIGRGFEKIETQCDLLLVDGAAGISDQNIYFLAGAERVLIVTSCDLTAMTDAYALIKVLHHRDPDVEMQLIVNRTNSEEEGAAAAQKIRGVARRFLGKEIGFLGCIPDDPAVGKSVAQKLPFAITAPRAPASLALFSIVQALESLPLSAVSKGRYSTRLLGGMGG